MKGEVWMRLQLQKLLEKRVQQCVNMQRGKKYCKKIERKKECLSNRSAEIVKARAEGHITHTENKNENTEVYYSVHFQYFIKQEGQFFIEEEVEQRRATFYRNAVIEDVEIEPIYDSVIEPNSENQLTTSMNQSNSELDPFEANRSKRGSEPFITIKSNVFNHPESVFLSEQQIEPDGMRLSNHYNRLKAVQYAEKWWNSYNPAYTKFEVDCTNFISQCLHEGGAPMRGYPNRRMGWWLRGKNWSFSWAVANSLKLYLSESKIGLRAREVNSAEQLLLGDVICYDFQGNGRFDHNTIVTGKDALGMPLVNAHTYNSRKRYWAYEDSTAYTPNIKYKFFTILSDE